MEGRDSFLDVRGRVRSEARVLRGADEAALAAAAEAACAYVLGADPVAAFRRKRGEQKQAKEEEEEEEMRLLESLFGGMLVVAHAAARSRLGPKDLAHDLESDLKMAPAVASTVANTLARLQKTVPEHGRAVPGMKRIEWRVEVTVSTSSLARVFKPSLLIALTADDATAKQYVVFECSRERFQLLRYQVAAALKACEDTSANPILKIE